MTDTPKDLHLAIWELLKPEEMPEGIEVNEAYCPVMWHDRHVEIAISIAHRCIVDAAREVLDVSAIVIYPKSLNRWVWDNDEWGSPPYPTRTEAIYHALKWLREPEGGNQ